MDLKKRTEFKALFNKKISNAGSVCILGHISPDGDCLGSTLSVASYIKNCFCADGKEEDRVRVYLEEASSKFAYLKGFSDICHDEKEVKAYDLCIVLDCGDTGRVGKFLPFLKAAGDSICVDHHITNEGFAASSLIEPDASSTSELVYDLFLPEYIDRDIAEAVYTGIIHDTGVFRYDCTSAHTMEIAGACMSHGIDFGHIIDDSFFAMDKNQKAVLGRVLSEMEVLLDGKIALGHIDAAAMELYGVTSKDMDGIVDQLRTTRGVLGAIFMYQCRNRTYKVSLRSNSDSFNAARTAMAFGGGGHVKAAGCFMGTDLRDDINKLVHEISLQLDSEEAYEQ